MRGIKQHCAIPSKQAGQSVKEDGRCITKGMVAVGNIADTFLNGQPASVESSGVGEKELITWGIDEVLWQAQPAAEAWPTDVRIWVYHQAQRDILRRIRALKDPVIVIVL